MNTIKVLLLCLMLSISLNLTAEEKEEITKEELLQKIELLEVEIEKVKIEAVDNDSVANGSTLNWGHGFALDIGLDNDAKYYFSNDGPGSEGTFTEAEGINVYNSSMVDLSFMHYFPITNKRITSNKKTITAKTGAKFGLGIQLSSKKHNFPWNLGFTDFYIGPKLSWTTPISSNFISFNFHYSHLIHITYWRHGTISAGTQMEFWMNEKIKLFMGPNFNLDFYPKEHEDDLPNFPIPYAELLFGLSYYF